MNYQNKFIQMNKKDLIESFDDEDIDEDLAKKRFRLLHLRTLLSIPQDQRSDNHCKEIGKLLKVIECDCEFDISIF